MRALCVLLFAPLLLLGEKWTSLESGPFQVVTDGGEKTGRDAMNYLEQLRYTLGRTLGKPDLKSTWPIRVLVLKPGKGVQLFPEVKLGRDAYVASVTALGQETVSDIVRILVNENAGPLPVGVDEGLPLLFSTLQVEGTHVTLGAKPPQPTRDWSRLHMLSVVPAYSGKLGVLLGNLQLGVDPEAAYRNAFEKTPQQIEAELNKYIEAGNYGTTPLNSRPLDPRRELYPKDYDSAAATLLQADNLLAHGSPQAKPAYEAILRASPTSAEALEGLGRYEEALKAGTKSARNIMLLAEKTSDAAEKKAALQKASELNPRWADPLIALAATESNLTRKATVLKQAAQLAPRNGALWQELAKLQEDNQQFGDANKSWAAAERAARDSADREKIHQARLATEQARLDAQEEARRAAIRKQQKELEDLKAKAMSDLRAFEARANAKASEGQAPLDPNAKLDWYKEVRPERAAGALVQVDCLGKRARLKLLGDDHAVLQLLVQDPEKVVIKGGGELALGCGVLKPSRGAVVEYQKKTDKKLGTVGEVTQIEFR